MLEGQPEGSTMEVATIATAEVHYYFCCPFYICYLLKIGFRFNVDTTSTIIS